MAASKEHGCIEMVFGAVQDEGVSKIPTKLCWARVWGLWRMQKETTPRLVGYLIVPIHAPKFLDIAVMVTLSSRTVGNRLPYPVACRVNTTRAFSSTVRFRQ